MKNLNKSDVLFFLCGGMGTRMKEETEFKPKPMVEIGSKPVVFHIMKSMPGALIMVLCLGFKAEYVKEIFKQKVCCQ